jgi:transcription-repair coupling factor (superfamily II helicase)
VAEGIAALEQLDLAQGPAAAPAPLSSSSARPNAPLPASPRPRSRGRKLALLGSPRDVRFLAARVARALKTDIVAATSWNDLTTAAPGTILALPMAVPRGFAWRDLIAIAAGDLIGSRAGQEGGGGQAAGELFAAPEIRPGDIVIHEDHGLAAVTGITELPEEGGDAIVLRFAGDAKRLVPVADAGKLWRYGSDEEAVTLDKLDGSSWEKRAARCWRRLRKPRAGWSR